MAKDVLRFPTDTTPPEGSKQIGNTETGAPIYQRTITKVVEKKQKTNEKGEPEFLRNQVTGQAIIPIMENTYEDVTETFVLVSDGRGQCFIRPYTPESEEEKERQRIAADVERFKHDLAVAAVEEGISPADLVRALAKKKQPKDAA